VRIVTDVTETQRNSWFGIQKLNYIIHNFCFFLAIYVQYSEYNNSPNCLLWQALKILTSIINRIYEQFEQLIVIKIGYLNNFSKSEVISSVRKRYCALDRVHCFSMQVVMNKCFLLNP